MGLITIAIMLFALVLFAPYVIATTIEALKVIKAELKSTIEKWLWQL